MKKKQIVIKQINLLSHIKMGKKILPLVILKLKKKDFTAIKIRFSLKLEILRKYNYLPKFLLVKTTINTLFVTCIMIIK